MSFHTFPFFLFIISMIIQVIAFKINLFLIFFPKTKSVILLTIL